MNFKSLIESILYVSGSSGIELSEIKKVTNISTDEIRKIIKEMAVSYQTNVDSGLAIKFYGNRCYLFTKPENKDEIGKLVDISVKNPLTPAALESLSIIAQFNPCTLAQVEKIRGTASDVSVKRLETLELIRNTGRSDAPGRPYLYEVTEKFFNLFGIKSLNDLPKTESENIDIGDVDLFNANRDE